jgi:glutathione synthase/RimK-type ligase-like ATP-grasp enzyme
MSTDNDQQVEMTEKEADRVEKAEREYWLVQEFLEEKYEEAKK